MQKMSKHLFITLSIFFCAAPAIAQQSVATYFDPAQAFNKVLLEKNSHTYYQVSNYKVIGTPFLYGENLKGSFYLRGKAASQQGNISFNTYDQTLQYNSVSSVFPPGSIDSFSITPQDNITSLSFVYGQLLGAADKAYYQVVYSGDKYSLYKKYYATLGVVSTNYIQSELRQFDLEYEYYYTDSTHKGLKKLKPRQSNVLKEFKAVKDLSTVLDENFAYNPEAQLIRAFAYLNQ